MRIEIYTQGKKVGVVIEGDTLLHDPEEIARVYKRVIDELKKK